MIINVPFGGPYSGGTVAQPMNSAVRRGSNNRLLDLSLLLFIFFSITQVIGRTLLDSFPRVIMCPRKESDGK